VKLAGVPEGVEDGVIDGDGEAVVAGGELTGDVVVGVVVAGVVVLAGDVQADREIRTDVTNSNVIIISFTLNLVLFILLPPLKLYTNYFCRGKDWNPWFWMLS